jgi:hypothetical protein
MKNIPQAYRPSYLWFWPPLILGGSVISAGTIHDLRRVKVPGTGPLWNPCTCPEQSWHHFKIKKWQITNYVQTQFSVICSNISMIIMYYEYMTTQYFVRFFYPLKPRVESFWGVLSCCFNNSEKKCSNKNDSREDIY